MDVFALMNRPHWLGVERGPLDLSTVLQSVSGCPIWKLRNHWWANEKNEEKHACFSLTLCCFCSRPDYWRWGICTFLLADHLSTCSFFSMYRVIGVGDVYIRCTCTHVWCYVSTSSSGDVNVLWMCAHPQSTELDCFLTHFRARALARVLFSDAHVSLVMSLVLFLHTCLMLRKYIVFRGCQRSWNVCTPADIITFIIIVIIIIIITIITIIMSIPPSSWFSSSSSSSSSAESSPGHIKALHGKPLAQLPLFCDFVITLRWDPQMQSGMLTSVFSHLAAFIVWPQDVPACAQEFFCSIDWSDERLNAFINSLDGGSPGSPDTVGITFSIFENIVDEPEKEEVMVANVDSLLDDDTRQFFRCQCRK